MHNYNWPLIFAIGLTRHEEILSDKTTHIKTGPRWLKAEKLETGICIRNLALLLTTFVNLEGRSISLIPDFLYPIKRGAP